MQHYIPIIIFIAIWSAISTGIWFILWKNKSKKFQIVEGIRTLFFYFAIYYGIMSMVKLILGNVEETLFESFWSAEVHTYVHYGIPMAIFSILVPILLKIVFKEKGFTVITTMNAILFAEIAVVFICGIRMENNVFTTMFLASGIIAVIYAWFAKEPTENAVEKDFVLMICAWMLWIVLTVISIPNEMYLTNLSEFPVSYWRFLIVILVGGILIGGIGMIGSSLFLTPRFYKGVAISIIAISTMGYIQSMFLNGELAAMDGEIQVWSMAQRLVNSIIWIIGIVMFLLVGFRKKSILKVFKGICIYIVAIQIVSNAVLIITTDTSEQKIGEALTTQDALSIHAENNVIVFLLDKFDGEIMDEILSENAEFVEPLKDFVYYENATSLFARTSMAIPYMLTGTDWPEGMIESEYPSYAYKNVSMLQDIVDKGYRVGIYSDMEYIDDNIEGYISNYSAEADRKCDIYGTIRIMTKCARYRLAPFQAKAFYSYYTSDIVQNIADNEGIWNTNNDIPFYELLQKDGISVAEKSNEEGAFLFYHMYGPHPPFRMTEDIMLVDDWESSALSQAKGSLKIVYSYLQQLKELGKYDDATILIVADHGIQMGVNEGDNPIPLVMVKEAGNSQETLQISSAPVTQKEFMPTILEAMGIDRDKYGRTFAEVPVDEVNERIHANIWDDNIETYVIKGNAKNPENWYPMTE